MIYQEMLWFYEKRYDFPKNAMILREMLWFTEKIYDLARNSKRQKCPYVMFFKKNWVLKIQKTDTFTKTYQTRFEKISLVLSRNLSFFLSISRFILFPYNGSGNGSIRCRNGGGNGTSTRRVTGYFVFWFFFCFISTCWVFLVFFFIL